MRKCLNEWNNVDKRIIFSRKLPVMWPKGSVVRVRACVCAVRLG